MLLNVAQDEVRDPTYQHYYIHFGVLPLVVFWLQVVLHPTPNSPKQSELHKMTVTKACPDQDLRIKLAIRMDKPQNMKHCG